MPLHFVLNVPLENTIAIQAVFWRVRAPTVLQAMPAALLGSRCHRYASLGPSAPSLEAPFVRIVARAPILSPQARWFVTPALQVHLMPTLVPNQLPTVFRALSANTVQSWEPVFVKTV